MEEILSENKKQDTALSGSYMTHAMFDSSKKTQALLRTMHTLTIKKSSALYDACDYHRGLFVFAYVLGITALFGTVIVTLLVKDGWNDASQDLKLSIGTTFLICSVSFFIPKLMNHELNYTANINTYYSFGKQLIYSTKVLTEHYCSDSLSTAAENKKILIATDSNFNVMNANLSMHYDLNFAEATKYFEDLKVNLKPSNSK